MRIPRGQGYGVVCTVASDVSVASGMKRMFITGFGCSRDKKLDFKKEVLKNHARSTLEIWCVATKKAIRHTRSALGIDSPAEYSVLF